MAIDDTTVPPGADGGPGSERLPCGRSLERLWDHLVGDRLDEHERGCVHCQTALPGLVVLREARQELRAEPGEPPPEMFERIMAAVRGEQRRGPRLAVARSELGPIEVSEQAVAIVLRQAVDATGQARARRCRVRGVPETEVFRVQMGVVVVYGTDIGRFAGWIRQWLPQVASAQIGLPVVGVDLVVEDLYEVPGGGG
ncbi:MAG: hypothetical protein ACRDP4_09930 [Nocardioidaceae bacterium]